MNFLSVFLVISPGAFSLHGLPISQALDYLEDSMEIFGNPFIGRLDASIARALVLKSAQAFQPAIPQIYLDCKNAAIASISSGVKAATIACIATAAGRCPE